MKLLLCFAAAVILLAGCMTRNEQLQARSFGLRQGLTESELQTVMGRPDRKYVAGSPNVWFYGGLMVAVQNGRVAGWRQMDPEYSGRRSGESSYNGFNGFDGYNYVRMRQAGRYH